jgi:transcriptional regulator with PAS, ATPase and Fis domain
MGKPINPLADDQLQRLRDHNWPGNVRELQT